jgi:thiol-disulfide isomerase/thioredoxin
LVNEFEREDMKNITFLMVFFICSGFITSCGKDSKSENTQTNNSKKVQSAESVKEANRRHIMAPDFTLADSEGNTLRLSDFRGKVVLLNFWATWCGPCRREIPVFLKLYEKYNDRGFEIIGVSVDQQGWDVITPFMDNFEMSYPVVLFNRQVIMNYGGIQSIPTSFFINREGEVVERIIGLRPDEYFETRIQELLSSNS